MANSIEVSGNSAVLRWLVASCQASAPWLSLTQDHIQIDWDLALQRWSQTTRKKSIPKELPQVLKKLLPNLPLARLCDLHGTAWRQVDMRSVDARIIGEAIEIPQSVRESISSLAGSIEALSKVMDEALSKKTPNGRGHYRLEWARPRLRAIYDTFDIQFLRRDFSTSFYLANRFAAAMGDMVLLLRGSSASYHYNYSYSDMYRRKETWRLAKRLVRAHGALFEQLETLVRDGVPERALELSETPLAQSWQSLAHIELSLARSLFADSKPRKGTPPPCFVTITQEFETLKTKDDTNVQQFKYGQYGHHYPFATLFGSIELLSELLSSIKSELQQKHYESTIRAVEVAMKGAQSSLTAAKHEVEHATRLSLCAQDIGDAIDWLIGESPLLTFYASGFLTVYPEHSQSKYKICLTPWLAATIIAKKQFGTLPMTYLGIDSSSDDSEQQAEGDEAGDGGGSSGIVQNSDQSQLTGRRLWELVQTAMA